MGGTFSSTALVALTIQSPSQGRRQAICAEIWRDAQQGGLKLPLNRYCLLVEGQDQDLLGARNQFAEEKKQGRRTHARRVVKKFRSPNQIHAEVARLLALMQEVGLIVFSGHCI